MHAVLLALLFSAEPAPALKSLSGLNVPVLKPWLTAQLPSLAQCAWPGGKEGTDEVSVQAQFSGERRLTERSDQQPRSPEVSVMRAEGTLSDAACVRGVVEQWKRDSKQPSAGPFSFTYRFKPSAAQRAAVSAQAKSAFAALCPRLPAALTAPSVREAVETNKPPLPMGARVSLEDAVSDAEALPPAKFSQAISKTLRDLAKALGAEPCS